MSYLRDPQAIYDASFATIAAEADLSRFSENERVVATRMIHACGMVDLARDVRFSPTGVEVGRAALAAGAPILCDVAMVDHGIIRDRLPAGNTVRCDIALDETRERAGQNCTTRSAAQVDGWGEAMQDAVVVIGNAPTALFRVLELAGNVGARPALVVGIPVGFVGAAESKDALHDSDVPHLTVLGRRGGSAIAAAAVNALAGLAR